MFTVNKTMKLYSLQIIFFSLVNLQGHHGKTGELTL